MTDNTNPFGLSDDDLLWQQIFFPEALRRFAEVISTGSLFAHYTSAEVAMSIIQKGEVWMRNTTVMNDFSEVEHGRDCVVGAWHSEVGEQLREAADAVHPGTAKAVFDLYDGWLPDMQHGTYITCISEHPPEEDDLGRLSMWRAYGGRNGVALVMDLTPFQATTTELGAFTSPVLYADAEQFKEHVGLMAERLVAHRAVLQAHSPDHLRDSLFTALRYATLCTKHPAFREEREWRVIYSPALMLSPVIKPAVRSARGVPQTVQLLPLRHDPANGLDHADIPSLLRRVIIGPAEDTWVLFDAFRSLLQDAGVQDAANRIWVSGIPLRHFS